MGRHCGSVVTMISGGKSVYGLLKNCYECVVNVRISWILLLLTGSYTLVILMVIPLTVTIGIGGLDIDNPTRLSVVSLYHIQSSRVTVELDHDNNLMCMLRMEGTDTNPIFNI